MDGSVWKGRLNPVTRRSEARTTRRSGGPTASHHLCIDWNAARVESVPGESGSLALPSSAKQFPRRIGSLELARASRI